MKIKQIDTATCKIIRKAIDENLAEIAAEMGLVIKAKNGTYDSGQVTFKVECAVIDAHGNVQTKAVSDFKLNAFRYGLDESDLGKEFVSLGKRYKIVGCKPRSYAYPILCEKVDGSGINRKFPVTEVKRALSVAS